MKRREFIKAAGVSTVGVSLAGCEAASDADCPDAAVTIAPVSDRQRFNYFGPDADAQGGYFKFMAEPATTIDFGLSPDDEARAAELHKTLHIFDSEPEVGYHPNLIDNLLGSGAGSVAGSFTMDGEAVCELGSFLLGIAELRQMRNERLWILINERLSTITEYSNTLFDSIKEALRNDPRQISFSFARNLHENLISTLNKNGALLKKLFTKFQFVYIYK